MSNPRVIVALLLLTAVATASIADEKQGAEFRTWASTHQRSYSSTEAEIRFSTWKENKAFIEKHNGEVAQGLHSYTLAVNQFADMNNTEYRQLVLGKAPPRTLSQARETFRAGNTTPPSSLDWRPAGIVTAVKNQAQCGSCWAFSAVAAMESAFNRKNNGSLPALCNAKCGPKDTQCCSFSEQEIVDCTLNGKDNCNVGGEMHDGYLEIINQQKGMINTESQYPYTSGGGTSKGKCHAKTGGIATGFTGYANVTHGDESALAAACAEHTVISVAIDASVSSFQFYSNGVYDEPQCKSDGNDLDHGVSVVGYGTYSGPSPGPTPTPTPSPAPPTGCESEKDEADCEAAGCEWLAGIHVCIDKDSDRLFSPTQLEQAAQATAAGKDYWLVKNSWGDSWGTQNGYILMSRNKNNQCGISTDAQYPLF